MANYKDIYQTLEIQLQEILGVTALNFIPSGFYFELSIDNDLSQPLDHVALTKIEHIKYFKNDEYNIKVNQLIEENKYNISKLLSEGHLAFDCKYGQFKLFENNKIQSWSFNDREKEGLIRKLNRNVGWQVTLRKDKDVTCDIQRNDFVNAGYNLSGKNYSSQTVHRGHLLASMFEQYLSLPHSFFGKGNKYNIYPQMPYANIGHHNGRQGQLQFEQKIGQYLMRDSSEYVYYEVEVIFNNKYDLMPIGSRLLAVNDDKAFNNFHVFIPNCC